MNKFKPTQEQIIQHLEDSLERNYAFAYHEKFELDIRKMYIDRAAKNLINIIKLKTKIIKRKHCTCT